MISDAEIERIQKRSKKIQLELNTIVHRFVLGEINADELTALTSKPRFTKSELWIYMYFNAHHQRKLREKEMAGGKQ